MGGLRENGSFDLLPIIVCYESCLTKIVWKLHPQIENVYSGGVSCTMDSSISIAIDLVVQRIFIINILTESC